MFAEYKSETAEEGEEEVRVVRASHVGRRGMPLLSLTDRARSRMMDGPLLAAKSDMERLVQRACDDACDAIEVRPLPGASLRLSKISYSNREEASSRVLAPACPVGDSKRSWTVGRSPQRPHGQLRTLETTHPPFGHLPTPTIHSASLSIRLPLHHYTEQLWPCPATSASCELF